MANSNSRVLQTGINQVTNPFGPSHGGIDIVKQTNQLDSITAHSAGTVIFCQTGIPNDTSAQGNDRSYGNCVKIRHSGGYCTLYAHMDSVNVKYGQQVSKGQKIGYMGNTGNSYGAHLHFEVRDKEDDRINPAPYLNSSLPGESETPTELFVSTTVWIGENSKGQLTKVALHANRGKLWYQAHLLGGGWLPKVTGFNKSEHENGYAGNGEVIDAIRAYYTTPDGETYQQARYAVKTAEAGWLPEQVDDNTNNGMDGYAGNFGQPILDIKFRVASR